MNLFGYSAPPNLLVEGSTDINATGYSLFFADLNHSAEIINPGIGLMNNAFDGNSSVRISGKGHRPSQWRYEKYQFGSSNFRYYTPLETTHAEYWGVYNLNGDQYFLHSSDDIMKSVGTQNNNNWNPINSAPGNSDRIGLPQGYDYNVNGQIDTVYRGEKLPSVIVEDWDQDETMGEPRDIELDFNNTSGHITLEHTGVGYAMPIEILLIKGQPQLEFFRKWVAEGNTTAYNFIPAEFRVDQVDENGSILNIETIDGGLGYENEPTVVITGGGGFGAKAEVIYNDSNGSIEGITVTDGGRGYYNIDPNNKPTASLAIDAADPLFDEVDATLSVRLGGFLDEIPRCSACNNQNHVNPSDSRKWYNHKDVWIEIWDRNRSEITIDRNGDRALAAAKVRNGKIEKIVVVNDGRGYVDPVAYVRAGPPHMGFYYGMPDVFSQRLGLQNNLNTTIHTISIEIQKGELVINWMMERGITLESHMMKWNEFGDV